MSDATAATPTLAGWGAWAWNEAKTIGLGVALTCAVFLHYGVIQIVPPAPTPPIPAPPQPGPVPPLPPPVPTWGPTDKILVLYESSKLTGKEPFYAQPVRDALTAAVPLDATTRVPNWRTWDKDVDASKEPAFADALAKAKADFGSGTDPVLYAFDAKGVMKTIPLKGLSDADVIGKIQGLKDATK